MSERFADILEQAFDRCQKYEDEGKTGLVKTTEVFHTFAELIVRECLEFVEPRPGSEDEWDRALMVAREKIKHHFGVE